MSRTSDRKELLKDFYGGIDEDARLCKSRHGQLEYMTTMEYIHRYLKAGDKVLEIGAGTGRYSVSLANEGFEVTAVELVESNLEVLKKNSAHLKNIQALQGDALDLSQFADNSFDVTLLFGPMYHLYDKTDQNKAIDEAIRVTKKGGVILTAFLSVHAIMYVNYLSGNFEAGLKENFDENYKTRHFTQQLFTGFEIPEFESLFAEKPVEHLLTCGTDSLLELAEHGKDFKMSDHDFKLFYKYYLANCEKRELLGSASHLLFVGKKR